MKLCRRCFIAGVCLLLAGCHDHGAVVSPSFIIPAGSIAQHFIPDTGVTISGNFSDGNIVTITKVAGGLGARTNGKPLDWFPMNNTLANDPTKCRNNRSLTNNNPGLFGFVSNFAPANSPYSFKWFPEGGVVGQNSAFSNDPAATYSQNVDTGKNQFYSWIQKSWNLASPPGNWKIQRWWHTTGLTPDSYAGAYNAANASFQGGTEAAFTSTGISNRFNGNVPIVNNTWYTDEEWFQEATPDTTDGILNWARDTGLQWEVGGRHLMSGAVNGSGTPENKVYLDEISSNKLTLTNITNASQAVCTYTSSNQIHTGDVMLFAGVNGMTQINGLRGTVQSFTSNTFTVNIDTTGFSAYTSGGTADWPPDGVNDYANYGAILFDDDFRQVILTNEGSSYLTPRWASGVNRFTREIQLQISRSDTAIQFQVRSGQFGSSYLGLDVFATTDYGVAVHLGSCV